MERRRPHSFDLRRALFLLLVFIKQIIIWIYYRAAHAKHSHTRLLRIYMLIESICARNEQSTLSQTHFGIRTDFACTHTRTFVCGSYQMVDRVRRDRGRAREWSVERKRCQKLCYIENISINTKMKREKKTAKQQTDKVVTWAYQIKFYLICCLFCSFGHHFIYFSFFFFSLEAIFSSGINRQ